LSTERSPVYDEIQLKLFGLYVMNPL